MSLDVRNIYQLSEPAAKKSRSNDVQTMSTATSNPQEIIAALQNDDTVAEDEIEIDEAAVKRLCAQLAKHQRKNQELRVKHVNEPERFMQSEIELNTAIQEMHAVATQPDLYQVLVELDFVPLIIQLLAHDNTDIVAAVCNLLQELCDIDILTENDESAAGLIDELLKHGIIQHLVSQPLARLDEANKDEFEAVHSLFSAIESILEFRPEASDLCIQHGLFVELMNRATVKSDFDSNKLYASQLLSVILQTSDDAKEKLVAKKDGIDFLLRALATYKKRDPESNDETEHMENLFNCLCAALLRPESRLIYLKDEGNELMYLMLKQKKESRDGALRVLSYVTAPPAGAENCDHFVEILGLRVLFPLFMKTPSKAKRKDTAPQEHEEHVCSIIDSLLLSCSEENRRRVLAKFVESGCEKVDRLVELFLTYSRRLRRFMASLDTNALDADEVHAERLNNGFYTLSKVALILADVCVNGEKACRDQASNLFRMKLKDASVANHLKPVLDEVIDNLGEEAEKQRERTTALITGLGALDD